MFVFVGMCSLLFSTFPTSAKRENLWKIDQLSGIADLQVVFDQATLWHWIYVLVFRLEHVNILFNYILDQENAPNLKVWRQVNISGSVVFDRDFVFLSHDDSLSRKFSRTWAKCIRNSWRCWRTKCDRSSKSSAKKTCNHLQSPRLSLRQHFMFIRYFSGNV